MVSAFGVHLDFSHLNNFAEFASAPCLWFTVSFALFACSCLRSTGILPHFFGPFLRSIFPHFFFEFCLICLIFFFVFFFPRLRLLSQLSENHFVQKQSKEATQKECLMPHKKNEKISTSWCRHLLFIFGSLSKCDLKLCVAFFLLYNKIDCKAFTCI